MTATITVLAEKGSPLSHTEMDNNFRALRNLVEVPTVAALRALGDGATPAGDGTAITHGCIAAGDGGGGLWRWDSSVLEATADNTGIIVKPTGHTGNGAWVRVYDGYPNVMWFGAYNNYTHATETTAAFQTAIDYFGSASSTIPTQTKHIYVPKGNYAINATIKLYSGVTLMGDGYQSTLSQATGLTGQIIGLFASKASPNDYCQFAGVKDLAFNTSGTVAAIRTKAAGASLTDATGALHCEFKNIFLQDCTFGLILERYTQSCIIDTVFSRGGVDQILYLWGNRNSVSNIIKEGGTGSSADAYIYIGDNPVFSTGSNNSAYGILAKNILLEGAFSSAKYGIELNSAGVVFDGLWIEPVGAPKDAFSISATGSLIQMAGYFQTPFTTNNKIKLVDSELVVDRFHTSELGKNVDDVIDMDASSSVIIGTFTQILASPAPTLPNVIIDTRRATSKLTNVSQLVRDYSTGANLLKNPSFEAGTYGWTTDTVVTTSVVDSTIAPGKMLRIKRTGGYGFMNWRRNVTIPDGLVNKPVTLCAWVYLNAEGAMSFLCGFTGVADLINKYSVSTESEWVKMIVTVYPTAAGTFSFGLQGSASDVYIDELSVVAGDIGQLNRSSFDMVNIGDLTHTALSAAPVSGTWKQGDIVYNTAPTAGGTIGWVCTAAGSPGTWKTFGTISA